MFYKIILFLHKLIMVRTARKGYHLPSMYFCIFPCFSLISKDVVAVSKGIQRKQKIQYILVLGWFDSIQYIN